MKSNSIERFSLGIFIVFFAVCSLHAIASASETEECKIAPKLQSNLDACSKRVSLPSVNKLYVLYDKNATATDRSSSNILIKAWDANECDNSGKIDKDKNADSSRIDCSSDFHITMKKISGGKHCGFIIDNPRKQRDQLKVILKRKNRSKVDNCEMQTIIRAPALTQVFRNVYNKAETQIIGMKASIVASSTSGDIHAEVTSPYVNLASKTGSLWAYGLTKQGKITTRGGDVAVQYCKTPEDQTGDLQLITLRPKENNATAGYVSLLLPHDMEYWMNQSLKKQLKKANHLKTQVPECGYANCKSFKMRGNVQNYMYVSALPKKAIDICRF